MWRIIGDPSMFDADAAKNQELEEYSSQFDELHFQIALNYGSRDEIKRAMVRMAEDVEKGVLLPQQITEDVISDYLDTRALPDPDLLIQTSSVKKGFQTFNVLAHTEFYFTDVAWPDFDKKEFEKAIDKFNHRDRRYGGVKEE